MATIEPRLIHLLNESKTPQLGNTDLPPLSSLPLSSPSDLPLPPIDREAGYQPDRSILDQTVGNASSSLSLQPFNDDHAAPHRASENRHEGNHSHTGSAGVYPLRVLLGESALPDAPPYHLNRIIDDAPDNIDDASGKKRNRGLAGKDEFLQLPQPMKKHKAAPHGPVMPPIINGLHEPPPDAALFPPIASNNFAESDPSQLKVLQELNYSEERAGQQHIQSGPGGGGVEKFTNKSRKRATKPRRKWTEEETNHLLLGVSRHGVGKWTTILDDTDFRFNERTAGDLKDRFRTCCPAELRHTGRDAQPAPANPAKSGTMSLRLENILRGDANSPGPGGMLTPPAESDVPAKPKKSRAHRKKMEDLESLGIHAPFKKSLRRERRPFTEQDDREILDGLHQYGPAWTKIQRDIRFHLSCRYPTDLRDRVRNKYPAIYSRIEKGTFQIAKDGCRGNDVMEPSVTMSINNSLQPSKASTLEPQVTQRVSREELGRWPPQITEAGDPSSGTTAPLEFGDSATTHLIPGEMDISRLLLEEPRIL